MADVWSANYSLFKTGTIISENQVTRNWDVWFGYPETIIDPFINSESVADANAYLEEIRLPWRVSTFNVVDGVKQWTVA